MRGPGLQPVLVPYSLRKNYFTNINYRTLILYISRCERMHDRFNTSSWQWLLIVSKKNDYTVISFNSNINIAHILFLPNINIHLKNQYIHKNLSGPAIRSKNINVLQWSVLFMTHMDVRLSRLSSSVPVLPLMPAVLRDSGRHTTRTDFCTGGLLTHSAWASAHCTV